MMWLLALVLLAPTPPHLRHPVRRKTAPHRAVHAPVRRRVIHHPPGMSPARALEIQHALMAAGYLDRASGHWDRATRAAMQRFQSQHHWQTRYAPDARALIALGLGPAPPTVVAAAAAAQAPGGGD